MSTAITAPITIQSLSIAAPITIAPITITAPITLGGRSAYQSYLATSADDPLLSEAEWSASREPVPPFDPAVASTDITDSTALGRSLITAETASAARTNLGLGTGDSPTFVNLISTGYQIDNRAAYDFLIPDANTTLPAGTKKAVLSQLSANRTFTLPSSSDYPVGGRIFIQIDNANQFRVITLQRTGSDTIDGSTAIALPTYLDKVEIYKSAAGAWKIDSRGTAWYRRDIKVGGIQGDSASSGSDGCIFVGGNANGNMGVKFPGNGHGTIMLPASEIIAWNGNNNLYLNGLDIGLARSSFGVLEVNGGTAGSVGHLKVNGGITQSPPASVTPAANGNLVFEATSNTSLTLKFKGSDGTIRSAVITLS